MAELENYIVIFGICAAILQGSSENICGPRKPDGKLKCCTFYHYNGSDCIECPHGYFGVHCNISCAYPTYGSRCKHNCTCKEEDCDNALGCSLTSTTEKTTRNSYQTYTIDGISNLTNSGNETTNGEETMPALKSLIRGLVLTTGGTLVFIMIIINIINIYSYRKRKQDH